MTDRLLPVRAGFLPLMDAAVLIAAEAKGFAAAEGIRLELVRETSWANVRDRLAVGHFDVAHMIAPMPIADALGLNPLQSGLIAPLAMGLGGNAVTVSRALWDVLVRHGAPADLDAASVGAALLRALQSGEAGVRPRFGVVHPHSAHNYELRFWLAACGIDPDRDIEIVVVPPPFLPDALKTRRIAGFCVGEPWNSAAVAAGVGRIATVKSAIWRSSPEKVLAMTSAWVDAHPETMAGLVRALYRAAQWCGAPDNLNELAALLAEPAVCNQPAEVLARGLSGRLELGDGDFAAPPGFFEPFAHAASFPWVSHALWYYAQMVRWGHAPHSAANAAAAAKVFRPDLYREVIRAIGEPVPSANAKVEGALDAPTPVGASSGHLVLGPDGFFTGDQFDPDRIEELIAAQRAALPNK